jgi:CRISPR type III-B/RAMP module RAMP protein Cmr6
MDRYVPSVGSVDKGSESSIAEFLENVASIAVPASYSAYYGNWKAAVQAVPNTHILEGTTAGPLAIGLGNDTSLEVGLTLHHTYGTPIIPGSALKGLAVRAAAKQREALGKVGMNTLFGAQECASLFVFWDALLVPGTQPHPLQPDIVTVHHPAYYSKKGAEWPTDFDDPTPVPFMTIKPGTRFAVTVSGPDDDWCRYAIKLLTWGLENLGIGGKTNAGYGRFKPFAALPDPPPVVTIKTITGCTVLQRTVKGVTTGEVTVPDHGPVPVDQARWLVMRKEAQFSEEQVNQLKKGKSINVAAVVTLSDGTARVDSISLPE